MDAKRANKYFPTITAILNEEGVPEDFKYLAVLESGLQQVRSYKGATGFLANYAHYRARNGLGS